MAGPCPCVFTPSKETCSPHLWLWIGSEKVCPVTAQGIWAFSPEKSVFPGFLRTGAHPAPSLGVRNGREGRWSPALEGGGVGSCHQSEAHGPRQDHPGPRTAGEHVPRVQIILGDVEFLEKRHSHTRTTVGPGVLSWHWVSWAVCGCDVPHAWVTGIHWVIRPPGPRVFKVPPLCQASGLSLWLGARL